MESNQQPESDEIKLRERLEEILRQARQLAEVTRAPANLPRVTAPRPALPTHETLLPGSILTTLFRKPASGRTVSFKREELGDLDGMTTDYLLNFYQSQSLFSPDDGLRLRNSIETHSRRYSQLLRNSDWRMGVFGYELAKEERLKRIADGLRSAAKFGQRMEMPVGQMSTVNFELRPGTGGMVKKGLQALDIGCLFLRMDKALIPNPDRTRPLGHVTSPAESAAHCCITKRSGKQDRHQPLRALWGQNTRRHGEGRWGR